MSELDALQKFLQLPPPKKCVKILRMVIRNLLEDPENPKFRSVLVDKVRSKFERAHVSWDIVIELFAALGFSREPGSDGRIEIIDFNLQAATTMLQLFEDLEKQQSVATNQEVADEEVLRAMHTWDLPPKIEAQLSSMISEVGTIWQARQDLIIDFFRPQNGPNIDNAIINTALVTLLKNSTDAQLKNWSSNKQFFLHNVPEYTLDFLLGEHEGRSGVQVLIETILASDLNVTCFQKVLYVNAQAGISDIDQITTCAAGRKVALVQLVDRLLEFFTTYYEKLSAKMLQEEK